MYHFAWADQRPVQGNISYISLQPGQYILPGKVVSLVYTLIFRMLHKKLAILYIVELVTVTCGMEFCILTIIKNAITFIFVDIYE